MVVLMSHLFLTNEMLKFLRYLLQKQPLEGVLGILKCSKYYSLGSE